MSALKYVCKYLIDNNLTISCAESLTGGLITAELINYPGISKSLGCGFVTYSNESKNELLGVKKETLEKYGAVSHETAREMAGYLRKKAKSDIALASTGIAGPSGGSIKKPVGTVYLSLAIDNYIITRKFIFKGSRYSIRKQSVNQAIKLLRDGIKKYKP